MDKTTLVSLVLLVLLIISVAQAVQINGIKDTLEPEEKDTLEPEQEAVQPDVVAVPTLPSEPGSDQ